MPKGGERLFVLRRKEVTPERFVEFWSRRYEYPTEHLYSDNIGRTLTEQRIIELYTWKNGSRLAENKYASVLRNYCARASELADLPESLPARQFLELFPEGGAIWRIFWLHIWQPGRFPIFDQHVHRARLILAGEEIVELSTFSDSLKIESYIEDFLPFWEQFHGLELREVDRALWAFGKFIQPLVPAEIGY